MKLAIRSSSGRFAIGLLAADGTLLSAKYANDDRQRAQNIADLYQELAADVAFTKADISEIIVDLGPGGLSATRAGVSFANALAFGLSTKLAGVSALELQMLDLRRNSDAPILSLRPAAGGDAFWAFYLGHDLKAQGRGLALAAIESALKKVPSFTLAGPLARICKGITAPEGVTFENIDPPSLAVFAQATKHAPRAGISPPCLEPTISIEAQEHD